LLFEPRADGLPSRLRDPIELYIMRKSGGVNRISLEAESVGQKALKALGKSGDGSEIHGVFDHAVYISGGKNELLKLILNKDFVSPYSILIKNHESASMKSLGFETGERVLFDGKTLTSGAVAVNISNARILKKQGLPKRSRPINPDEVAFNLRILRDVIYTFPGREGLVPLLEDVDLRGPMKVFLEPRGESVAERARPHIEQLMWGLYSGDLAAVSEKAGAILGLGPGLTPSCDDFLAGLLMSLCFAGKAFSTDGSAARFFTKVGNEIFRLSKVKTTTYSRGLLDDARRGEGPLAATGLIVSLVAGGPEDTAASAKKLLAMGATTGADMAVGIYYGVRYLGSMLETEALNEIA